MPDRQASICDSSSVMSTCEGWRREEEGGGGRRREEEGGGGRRRRTEEEDGGGGRRREEEGCIPTYQRVAWGQLLWHSC